MQYVQPVGGLANDPYVDANPGAGQEGSPVPAAAIEHPMRELVALITDAGLVPSGASLTQVGTAIKTLLQKAGAVSAAASGTVDAITANFTPAIAALSDHLLLIVRAGGANTSTTPTFTPASATIAAKTIVKGHNQALVAGDISGAGFRAELQYDLTLDKWVLLNPATGVTAGLTVVTAASDPTFVNSSASPASTNWVRGALPLTKEYVSAAQTIVAGGLLTLSHSLGVMPKIVTLEYVCTIATDGYSIGDVIDSSNFNYDHTDGTATGFSTEKTTTQLLIRCAAAGPAFFAVKSGGGQIALANIAPNFKLVARAFA